MMTSSRDLSEDMMIETLSRLPVKSLLRFRCVCKSWYALFKNANFIYKHLKNDDNTRLIVRYAVYYNDDDDLRSFFSLFPDETLENLSLDDFDPEKHGVIIGPYDGIFCLLRSNFLITLWNLATKEYRVLPKCNAFLPHYTTVQNSNIGFGLDPVNNDYKLVLIFTLWDGKRRLFYEFSHVAVYTFSTNSWRGFRGFKMSHDYMYDRLDSIYLNGVCYWLVLRVDGRESILSFDMSNEVFQEIQGPSDIPESAAPRTLGFYNDSLSLILLNMENCFEIWVMKERCWSEHLVVGPFEGINGPLGFWKKGAFFIESSSGQLLLYDPRTQEMRDLGLRGLWFSVYIYRESLITVKAEDVLLDEVDIPWHILGVYHDNSNSN